MNSRGEVSTTPTRFSLGQIEKMLLSAFGITAGHAPDIRWRIKQMQRHDWPDTVETDTSLRRGYTPRQALRILTAAALLDAGLGPTDAIRLARENENAVLAIMTTGIGEADYDQRIYAIHRPGVVGSATGRLDADSPLLLLPAAREDLVALLAAEERGRSVTVLDLAGMARRGLDSILEADPRAQGEIGTMFAEASHATMRGDGYIPSNHPVGDRYLSPRRRRLA